MKTDEQAIRELVEKWLAASKSGDLARVLSLMSDDVIFMVPGNDPFRKEEFAARSKAQKISRSKGRATFKSLRSSVIGHGWATVSR